VLQVAAGRFGGRELLSPEEQAKVTPRQAGKKARFANGGQTQERVRQRHGDRPTPVRHLPTDYNENMHRGLREPYAVAIDQTALASAGRQEGRQGGYNGKTITSAYITHGYPNIIQPTLVMSRDTLRLLGEADTASASAR
jgi:putative ABC transport system permease protein